MFKKNANDDALAENLPFEAYSVIGNKLVTVKFDLDSKEAIVSDVAEDTRDQKGVTNYMAMYKGIELLKKIGKKYMREDI